MGIHLNKLKWFPGILFLLFSVQVMANVPVGHVEFVRGTVAVEKSGQDLRMLGKGEEIFEGDNIQTSENSFAVLFFNDDAKITIRPNTSFSIDAYLKDGDNPMADLSLHKGGVKVSSGEIAKKNTDNFRIHTAKAVVKASKADYTVRLCGKDCAEESKQLKPLSISTNQTVIARAVEVKGSVTAQSVEDGTGTRLLKTGGPIYRSDRITAENGSNAIIAFRDESRITIQPGSTFEIKDYNFKSGKTEDKAKLGLVKGGLRVLTGIIGKANKKAFEVETPIASIGIRGTGFDLMFIIEQDASGGYKVIGVPRSTQAGLYSNVWDGAIVQTNDAGEFVLLKGQANLIINKGAKPRILKDIPIFFKQNLSPRPDQIELDMINLFGSEPVDGSKPGLYITVESGHVEVVDLNGVRIDLGKTEAAFVDLDGNIVRMDVILNFQGNDPYPMPSNFSPETAEVVFSLLIDDIASVSSREYGYNCRCD